MLTAAYARLVAGPPSERQQIAQRFRERAAQPCLLFSLWPKKIASTRLTVQEVTSSNSTWQHIGEGPLRAALQAASGDAPVWSKGQNADGTIALSRVFVAHSYTFSETQTVGTHPPPFYRRASPVSPAQLSQYARHILRGQGRLITAVGSDPSGAIMALSDSLARHGMVVALVVGHLFAVRYLTLVAIDEASGHIACIDADSNFFRLPPAELLHWMNTKRCLIPWALGCYEYNWWSFPANPAAPSSDAAQAS